LWVVLGMASGGKATLSWPIELMIDYC